jgi:hypothetical protein
MSGFDASKIAQQMEIALNYQIAHEDTEFFEEMTDFIKGGCIFGTSYIAVYPKFSEVNGRYLRPMLKTSEYWDVLPVAGARRMSKARGVFIREFWSKEELKEFAEKGVVQDNDQLKSLLAGSGDIDNWHKQLLAEVGITNYSPSDDDIEILHYFSGGHVISLANRGLILRDSRKGDIKPYPYDHPEVQYKFIPVPMEWFGVGIPETLEVLQEDKNLIRSARRDNIDLIINKILLTKPNADLNFDMVGKYYAGAIWPDALGQLDALQVGDVTQSSYVEEDKVRFDMENALSMFGYARGMTPAHEERPTTVIKLQQASMNRLDLAIKLAEFSTLQNIANRIILLTRRYMTQQDYEAIIGDKDAGFFAMPEEHVKEFFEIKPMGSSVTHVKEIRLQQIIQFAAFLEKAAPYAQVAPQPFRVDVYEFLKEAGDVLDITTFDKIVPKMMMPPPNMGQGLPPGMALPPMQPVTPQDMQSVQQVPFGGQQNAMQGR